jgi:hypothetical protein
MELLVEKPDGTIATWIGNILNIFAISYITVEGDFDQAGEYKLQAYIESPSWKGRGQTVKFYIFEDFK